MQQLEMVGESAAHRGILDLLGRVAETNAEVVLSGPSGVGKEVYAGHLHRISARAHRSFVPVNCGAIPEELFENELFGHAPGAYTGAASRQTGLVEEAQGGTLFLDEIDALSLANQVKLLRLVQSHEYRPLGQTGLRKADVRFVTATNADLKGQVDAGRFRLDLFFRLWVFPVAIPPLRERPDDVPPLFNHFTRKYAEAWRLHPVRLESRTLDLLCTYPWPGNVRELENCVRRLICMGLDRPARPSDLQLFRDLGGCPSEPPATDLTARPFKSIKKVVVDRFEQGYLRQALERAAGNVTEASRISGMDRRAFFELMRKHQLSATPYRM